MPPYTQKSPWGLPDTPCRTRSHLQVEIIDYVELSPCKCGTRVGVIWSEEVWNWTEVGSVDFLKIVVIIQYEKIFKAEEIFKDFPNNIKSKIFAAAEGKLVYFPKNQNKKYIIDQESVLIKYAQSKK